MKRRTFLRQTFTCSSYLAVGSAPLTRMFRPELTKLTILHTNDWHSRIDPFPMDGSRNQGLGGAAKRAQLIKKVRAEEQQVLLLDSGDILQGTPYFNYFGGELEFKLMSEMGYDAATIGNHDFDAGLDGLIKILPHANFPFLNCNYDFRDTEMHDQTLPYKVFNKSGIKVGILGVGIALEGLVPEKLYGQTKYLDPVTEANKIAAHLKNEIKCDLVICLSHLGYKYKEAKIDDIKLAKNSSHIDIILGGHTHTFMKAPEIVLNTHNKPVTINQVGWAGILLGRLDLHFEFNRKNKCISCQNQWVL